MREEGAMEMKQTAIFTFLMLVLGNVAFTQHARSIDGIQAALTRYLPDSQPGATVGIIDNGELVFSGGYGMADIGRGIGNDPSVAYQVASVSKQFTAAAIADLVNRQLLDFSDDVRRYIPEFPDYGTVITIDHLLYHTSGVRDYMVLLWLSGIGFESTYTNTDALSLICGQQALNFRPGSRCVYSNSNYALLATILERVTGQSLNEYVTERLFVPLGMLDSGFAPPTTGRGPTLAVSYREEEPHVPFKDGFAVHGDGGLWTTLHDLRKWDALFYDTASVSATLLQPGKLENGGPLYYGRGIILGNYRSELTQSHSGAFLGYRAELLRFPARGLSFICMANSERVDPESLTRWLADSYLFGDAGALPSAEKPNYDADEANEVVGSYEVAPNVLIDITYDAGTLVGQVTGQPRQVLYPEGGLLYRIGNTADQVRFGKGDTGRGWGLTVIQQAGQTDAQRLTSSAGHLASLAGSYDNVDLSTMYELANDNGRLVCRMGDSPWTPLAVVEKYDRASFHYKNLEKATLSFKRNATGAVTGFTLSTGRIAGLDFEKR